MQYISCNFIWSLMFLWESTELEEIGSHQKSIFRLDTPSLEENQTWLGQYWATETCD